MAESVTNDRPPVAARPRSRKPATVSAPALGAPARLQRYLRAQRYRIARSAIWIAFCVSRRFDVQRDCSIRHSLRTKKQVSVTCTGT